MSGFCNAFFVAVRLCSVEPNLTVNDHSSTLPKDQLTSYRFDKDAVRDGCWMHKSITDGDLIDLMNVAVDKKLTADDGVLRTYPVCSDIYPDGYK